ncbi:DMT family transporter [Fictibacillus norfolkensis]|uniref:DMT family transporter n=1 Tax=Fictibacillus norfolkensis TaxID=2762233 RepID=A0ABR8SQU6_9BACL|nr:DMT family transporter [Fictibacillus norfolkensis]MBD7965728.1 DMT family transporter [Fictibacillus norfolkensis]
MISFRKMLGASLYATMSISFWGISFVSTKAVLDKLDPFTLLVIRFGIGALFLFILILVKKKHSMKLPIQYIPHLIVLGILGVFLHQVIQASALLSIDASSAGWLITFSPVFTVVLSMVFLHEELTVPKAVGIILAISGVLLVTTAGGDRSLGFSINIGYLLMVLSTLNWAIYSVLLKSLKVPLPALVLTFYMSALGLLLTLPFIYQNKSWEKLALLDGVEWAHLIFLGVFVSGIAYWYWAKALEVLEATQVSVFLYLEPISTLIAAVLLLHEKVIYTSILGGAIIILGVIIVNGHLVGLINRWSARR